MLPVKEMASQLTISAKLRELLDKYENHIYQQIMQGIVDPMTVFMHLFEKYCEGGVQIKILQTWLYNSKNHIDFLKDTNVSSMEDMLAHLNGYWGSHHVDPESDFYAMCFIFFLYYGAPPPQYVHLQQLAIAVINKIKNACNDNDQLIKRFQWEIEEDSKFHFNEAFFSKINLDIHEALINNNLSHISSVLISILQTLIRNYASSKMVEMKKLLYSCQRLIINFVAYKDMRDKFVNDALFNFEFLDIDRYDNYLFLFAIMGRHDQDLNKLLINILISNLNGRSDHKIKYSILVLCYCDIPVNMQREIISDLLKLYESYNFFNKKELTQIFNCVEFDPILKQAIIDKFINILNCYHRHDPFVQSTLESLACIDMTNVYYDALIPVLLTLSEDVYNIICKIFIKIDIPEKYQFELIEKLFLYSVPPHKYIFQLYLRCSIAQQLYWRTKLLGLFLNHEHYEDIQQLNPIEKMIFYNKNSFSNYCGFSDIVKGMYHLIRLRYPLANNQTIVARLPSINVKSLTSIERNLRKIVTIYSDIQTIYNKICQYNSGKHPAINDVLFFYIVSLGNMNNIKMFFLTNKPNINFALNTKSMLQLLANNHENGDQIAIFLISHGADVNFKCPLYDAVIAKNTALVKVFLNTGPKVTIYSSMKMAFEMELSDIMMLFIDYCFKNNETESTINQLLWVLHGHDGKYEPAKVRAKTAHLIKILPAEKK